MVALTTGVVQLQRVELLGGRLLAMELALMAWQDGLAGNYERLAASSGGSHKCDAPTCTTSSTAQLGRGRWKMVDPQVHKWSQVFQFLL